jgi:urease accessory protein UreF
MRQRASTIPAGSRLSLKQAGEQIIKLYEEWGKPEKAAAWREKLQVKEGQESDPPAERVA